jgi:tRNA(fMet)-specific endonuclease VapC
LNLWILDTDHVSLHQRGNLQVTQQLANRSDEMIAIAVITVEEQLRGWLNVIRQAESAEKSIVAYSRLKAAVQYFHGMNILELDLLAYNQYLKLKQQKIRIGSQDLKIAAIALSQNATLVTRNRQDFEKVPGLRMEDWSNL